MKYLKMNKYISALVLSLFMSLSAIAQSTGNDAATPLHANGKIWVVVTCLSIIFLGIVIYVFSLERKVKKLEDLIKNK